MAERVVPNAAAQPKKAPADTSANKVAVQEESAEDSEASAEDADEESQADDTPADAEDSVEDGVDGVEADEDPAQDEPEWEAPALRTDGPTLAEYVKAGYKAENYPPRGFAVRVDPDEGKVEQTVVQGVKADVKKIQPAPVPVKSQISPEPEEMKDQDADAQKISDHILDSPQAFGIWINGKLHSFKKGRQRLTNEQKKACLEHRYVRDNGASIIKLVRK